MRSQAFLKTLLGGMTPQRFLSEYWQKKPLLVRQAIPGFTGLIDWPGLKALLLDEEVQARLIERRGRQWSLETGPFDPRRLKSLSPDVPWTVLVQELNTLLPEADRLLHAFGFVPWARVDDLMVSYAVKGGGVGPHVDSYDVFLLQGPGKRRWRISGQDDLELRPDLPLKILKRFIPEAEWVLEPGDMLYLPPKYAHEGVAVTDCFTYSIGFRAPSNQEWVSECLMDRAERDTWPGHFTDPGRRVSRHPGELPLDMVTHLEKLLKSMAWSRSALIDFNGRYLTEPKSHQFFDGPESPLSLARFKKVAMKQGLECDSKTRLLYQGDRFWINGESHALTPGLKTCIEPLADVRAVVFEGKAAPFTPSDWAFLYEAYASGFLKLRRA